MDPGLRRGGDRGSEQLIEILARLATPAEAKALAAARERRSLRLGRTTAFAVLDRLLAGAAAADPGRFAVELEGQLSRDPAARLADGFALLRSPAVSQRAKFLLEGPFLARLLDSAGARLAELLPSFAAIAELGGYAQLLVAGALGRASRGRGPLASEFLEGVLRAERMDLAGAFLRAAGRGYLRRLDARRHGALRRALAAAWRRPALRLDLAPFGDEIGLFEEKR